MPLEDLINNNWFRYCCKDFVGEARFLRGCKMILSQSSYTDIAQGKQFMNTITQSIQKAMFRGYFEDVEFLSSLHLYKLNK